MRDQHLIVVGGGLVGAAVGYGAARLGLQVTVLDQGDAAYRASRGNFGLVWAQAKGDKLPRYGWWSREAIDHWPALSDELAKITGIDVGLRQPGGFWLGFSEKDVIAREQLLKRLHNTAGAVPYQIMDNAELRRHLPGVGPAVVGGSFCPLDGHANPLKLLQALHLGIRAKGGETFTGVDVDHVAQGEDGQFTVTTRSGRSWTSHRIVLAAGLGNARLAPAVGLNAAVFPERGQVLVTERLQPFLKYPTNKLRQTVEGSVQIGSTSEDVGFDDTTTTEAVEWMARRAVATFPAIGEANLIRAWGALRVMTADGFPIYQASEKCPGAIVVTSHSGVSLAAAHTMVIGRWAAGLAGPPEGFDVFRGDRFPVSGQEAHHAH